MNQNFELISDFYPWLVTKLTAYNSLRPYQLELNAGTETRLYGSGALDSMQLVDFIMFIEDAFFEDYGKRLLLADGAAFSQKRSPYLNLGSFAAFIQQKADA